MKLKTIILAMLSTGSLFAGVYKIDIEHSDVAFKVRHMMVSNVKGHFNKFSGTFEYDEKTKILKSLDGTVDINSINTQNEKRDEHLRSADFFDAVKFPSMTLNVERVKGNTAYTKLTMHGITKNVKMKLVTSGIVVKDPWGNSRTGLSLYGELNRNDFGLNWNQMIEAGGFIVGETIKISLEAEGILTK